MSPDVQTVTALVTAGLPTLTVLVSILINNHRLGDMNQRISDFHRSVDRRFDDVSRRFDDVNRRFDEQRDMWRADLFRVEQVLDARLKHLEEHR